MSNGRQVNQLTDAAKFQLLDWLRGLPDDVKESATWDGLVARWQGENKQPVTAQNIRNVATAGGVELGAMRTRRTRPIDQAARLAALEHDVERIAEELDALKGKLLMELHAIKAVLEGRPNATNGQPEERHPDPAAMPLFQGD